MTHLEVAEWPQMAVATSRHVLTLAAPYRRGEGMIFRKVGLCYQNEATHILSPVQRAPSSTDERDWYP